MLKSRIIFGVYKAFDVLKKRIDEPDLKNVKCHIIHEDLAYKSSLWREILKDSDFESDGVMGLFSVASREHAICVI